VAREGAGTSRIVTRRNPPDAVRQKALRSLARWREAGLSGAQIRALIRSGDLIRMRRGLYATRSWAAFGEGDDARAHALLACAVLRGLRGYAVVSHHSAARIYGMEMLRPPGPEIVTITAPPGTRGDRAPWSNVIRRRASLPESDIRMMYGIPVTTVARTVIDIARGDPFMEGVVAAESALRKELTHTAQLLDALETYARWPGGTRARLVAEFADRTPESVLESCSRVVFHLHGLKPPVLQYWIPGARYRADFCWPDCKVIAECDGLAKYADDPKRIGLQIRRDNELRRLGYEVVHFTWEELFRDPERIVNDILDAMRKQRGRYRR
jgi:very-short-patch-repair endonuclease/predicted transcriptional regulator of viral defense system